MKVLLISEFFPTGNDLRFSGGVEARTFYLAKYLAKKHRVTVLTSKIGNAPVKEKLSGFLVLRVGHKRRYSATATNLIDRINFIREATKSGEKIDCDIVDGSNFITHLIAKRIADAKIIPSVAWYPDVWLGSWSKNAGLTGILGEILERFNLKRGFDAYIAISEKTAQKLKGRAKNNVTVIPCGIDDEEFKNQKKEINASRILCVSRLAKYKNIRDLILAFALLSTKVNNPQLVIVGTGPEYKGLKNLIKQLMIEDKVKFLFNLPREKLIGLYYSSRVFCLPSRVEGFGISVIEAAASQTPYVISDIDVFKEITKNGQGGLIFKLGDIKDLSYKIEKLLTDQNLYAKKSKEALSLAQNYQWKNIAKLTEELYRTLIL